MGPAEHGTTGPDTDAPAPAHSQGEPGIARTRDGRELFYRRLARPMTGPTRWSSRAGSPPGARDLHRIFVERAEAHRTPQP